MKMSLSICSKEYQDLEERVVKGTLWLDKNIPDWWKYIKTNSFDIGSPCHCVLGQLDLWDSRGQTDLLSLAYKETLDYGFDLSVVFDDSYSKHLCIRSMYREHSWNTLQYLWLREIRERKNPSFGNDVY